jgi:outer membrane receptor for ferrienterochelin and colicin
LHLTVARQRGNSGVRRTTLRHIRQGLLALLGLSVATLAWAGMHVRLDHALDQLRAQGISIIYSTALAPADLYIDVDALTLDAVRTTLPTVGLKLDERDGHWLLVKGPTVAAAAGSEAIDAAQPGDASRIETIIVTGTRHRFATIGTESANVLSSEELDRVPALGGDSLRSVNLLPGMSSMGVSVRPRIRGGLDDELLVLLDGVEILDPYHFANYQNLFSAIDGRVIDRLDVYSGGFPARYGNRMSGVMEIDTLAQRDKPTAEVGVSLYSAFANARNPDRDSDTSWLASARYGKSDQLMERLGLKSGRPYFSDAMGRVGHAFNSDTALYFGGLALSEDISLNNDEQRATWKTNSTYLWSRFDGRIDDRITSSTTVSYMSSRNQIEDTSPASEELAAGFLDDSRDTTRTALRSDFAVATENTRQEFGIQADWIRTNYDSRALIDRGPLGVLFDGQAISAHEIAATLDGVNGGLYWSGDLPIGPGVSMQPGVRWDFQTADGYASQVSPRIGISWLASDDLTLRFDAGRYYQPDRVNEMDTADGVDHLYKPQRADHYIASAMWHGAAGTLLRVDAYLKQYERTTPRFENVFDPFVILPQVATDRVEIDASRARAHGVDLEWQRALTDRTSVIGRYSYMDADDKVGGRWVSRRWSQRHTITGIVMWTSDALTASAALNWHSGWRTTAPPPSVPVGVTIPIQELLNNQFLNDYFSVDLGFSASHPLWRSTVTLFADITNTLNRQNPVGIDYAVDESAATVEFSRSNTALLPIVAWVGIVVAF